MSKEISKNKQLMVNMVVGLVTMIINYSISLLLTPYIVATVSGEAYGFVALANTMVNYAAVITIALNSVAGRFITIEIHRGNPEKANKYFNAVIVANIIIGAVLTLIGIPIIVFLDQLIEIPIELVIGVKYLFVFILINFILTIVGTVFTVGTFITNKLCLSSIVNCVASLLKIVVIVLSFRIFPTNIAYIGMAAIAYTVVEYYGNFRLTKKLVPSLKLNVKQFSISYIFELIKAGIWSSVTKLSQILSDGLDLLISNVGVSSYMMGQLSIAYTMPTLLASFLSTIATLFNPQQTYYYAKNDIKGVVSELKLNMKMTGFFMSVVFCGIVTCGLDFYKLWVPTEDVLLIYKLSIISIISVLISGTTTALNSVFLLTNKLKVNSLVYLFISFFDILTVFVLFKTTSLGIYAVAGVSKIVSLFINLTYLPIYASACLKVSKKTFYPIILKYLFCTSIILGVFVILKYFMGNFDNWLYFGIGVIFLALVGLEINFYLFLNKEERVYLTGIIKNKIKK